MARCLLRRDARCILIDTYWAASNGRRNTSMKEVVVAKRKRVSDRCLRRALGSPGRPPVTRRKDLVQFWTGIARGVTSEEAAVGAGASPAVGARWFRGAGGMPPTHLSKSSKPLSGRYLSFMERGQTFHPCRPMKFLMALTSAMSSLAFSSSTPMAHPKAWGTESASS